MSTIISYSTLLVNFLLYRIYNLLEVEFFIDSSTVNKSTNLKYITLFYLILRGIFNSYKY
jgi:hypothetical protein